MRTSRLETELTAYTKTFFGVNSASLLAYTDELLLQGTDKTNTEGINNINNRILIRSADPAYDKEKQLVLALWERYDKIDIMSVLAFWRRYDKMDKIKVFRKVYDAAVDAMPLEYPSSDGLFLT